MPVARSMPFRSVLCAVDFSEQSRLAVRYAAALASRAHGRLTLLFVNDPLLVAAAAAGYDSRALDAAARKEFRQFVRSTLSAATLATLDPTFEVALGRPAREILRVATVSDHDIVVVGTRGLNAGKRILLGSTTTEVLRKTRVPVLAVPWRTGRRPPSISRSWPGREVLVPVDLDTCTKADLARVAAIARPLGASLTVMHAVPVPPAPTWFGGDTRAFVRKHSADVEAALLALTAGVKNIRTRALVRYGYPPEEISAVAAERHASLIVMTLRRGQGLFGEPSGTVTYQVLCQGGVPVLALPDVGKPRQRR